MQYWVFFQGGVGGDGFANFLEQADGITPVDRHSGYRIPNIPGASPTTTRFGMPQFAYNPWLFKQHDNIEGFDLKNVRLLPDYIRCIVSNESTVISVHPQPYFNDIEKFRFKNIIQKNQVRIYLTTTNYDRVVKDFYEKNVVDEKGNPWPEEIKTFYRQHIEHEIKYETTNPDNRYHYIINIDEIWRSWNYTKSILCDQVGLKITEEKYQEYLKISKRP